MELTKYICDIIDTMRQNGQTSNCIGVLQQNKDARMVVGSYSMWKDLATRYPQLKDRIISVGMMDKLHGCNVPLVWDNTAVLQIIKSVQDEVRSGYMLVKVDPITGYKVALANGLVRVYRSDGIMDTSLLPTLSIHHYASEQKFSICSIIAEFAQLSQENNNV